MSIFSKEVGIDLGTNNTRMCISGQGITTEEPTILSFNTESGKLVAVGKEAKRMMGRNSIDNKIEKPIYRGQINDHKIATVYIKELLKQVNKWFYIFKPDVTVSTPTVSTEMEKRTFVETLKEAGARSVEIVPSGLMAGFGVGINLNEPNGRMVVDIGASTTEIAVISYGGLVGKSTIKVGGNDMDKAIIEYLKEKYGVIIGDITAETVKNEIGSATRQGENMKISVQGMDSIDGYPKTIEISTKDVTESVEKSLEKIIEGMSQVFLEIPPEITSDIIDFGIILTGGVSEFRNIDKYIEQKTKTKTEVSDNTQNAVIGGISKAIQSQYTKQKRKSVV